MFPSPGATCGASHRNVLKGEQKLRSFHPSMVSVWPFLVCLLISDGYRRSSVCKLRARVSITGLSPERGKRFPRLCQVKRGAGLQLACWRGERACKKKKNQMSWCALVSRRRAPGTPLEWSFIRCLRQVYRIRRVQRSVYVRAIRPDPFYLFLHWIIPPRGQREQSSVRTPPEDMSAFWHCAHSSLPSPTLDLTLGWFEAASESSESWKLLLRALKDGDEMTDPGPINKKLLFL